LETAAITKNWGQKATGWKHFQLQIGQKRQQVGNLLKKID